MKGLPLAYNKDMQEDKEPVFDAIDTIEMCIPVFGAMLRSLTVRPKKHGQGGRRRLHQRYRLRRLPDQEGHALPGGLYDRGPSGQYVHPVRRDAGHPDPAGLPAISNLFDADIYDALELKHCVSERKVFGGPSHGDVERQISYIKDFVAQRRGGAVMRIVYQENERVAIAEADEILRKGSTLSVLPGTAVR